jgi:hypothetical protein
MMILYGLILLVLVYLALHYFYSVQYVGGTALYGSPVTQALFPGEKSMPPIWGTNPIGMMNADSTKYGQGSFWPEHVPYQAKKSGSGGPHPSGGERGVGHYPGVELRDGYDPIPVIRDIYDESGIPEKKVWEVGWWGY